MADHAPEGSDPALFGEFQHARWHGHVKPAFQLLEERVRDCTPEWAEGITGIPAATIRSLAHEMGVTARDQTIELPIAWTDWWGKRTQESVKGNPVAFHAMRGLAAHSNGFQTTRALAILMSLLGTIDRPGGFRHKAPYPRAVPPNARPPQAVRPGGASPTRRWMPRRWAGSKPRPTSVVDDAGEAGAPGQGLLAGSTRSRAHGLMHNAITNAWRGDPYPNRHTDALHGQHGLELVA